MLVKTYISQKLSSFGVTLKEADLVEIYLSDGVNYDMEICASNKRQVDASIAKFIPKILAMPDVTEGSMSISINRDGLKQYYSFLCNELGIENTLKPKIKFI